MLDAIPSWRSTHHIATRQSVEKRGVPWLAQNDEKIGRRAIPRRATDVYGLLHGVPSVLRTSLSPLRAAFIAVPLI